MSFPSDLEIALNATAQPIQDIADKLGLTPDVIRPYGHDKAKIVRPLGKGKVKGKLILVTAISPTKAGEGKTTTSIALAQGLGKLGKEGCVVLREPSMGPVMGIKGGAAGGGYSQVIPMVDINLHFTGDLHAITAAHNLLAAMLDNHLHFGNKLEFEPRTILYKRVLDMNDRSLRHIMVGMGGRTMGVPREAGFDITAASEIMAILCLANDFTDLKERLGNILLGQRRKTGEGIYARDLEAQGALAVVLKDAMYPNLVQTLEGTPAILHGGPFANIAQGTNSVVATRMGLELADYVVTEAGFGADLGAEKFLDIKCGYAGLRPEAVVVVATIRALKMQGGEKFEDLKEPNVGAVKRGMPNLEKHLESMGHYGLKGVVALNNFATDSDEEIQAVVDRCAELGWRVELSKGHPLGGAGATDLAQAVLDVIDSGESDFRPLYDWNLTVKEKIEIVAKKIYGASGVNFTKAAMKDLKRIKRLGCDKFPVCIAKTPLSLSDDPKLMGRPEGFEITVREIEIANGAGFVVPITGDVMRMPGLPRVPGACRMDVGDDGRVVGLD